MAQVNYTVDLIDGVWKVGLNGRYFGPYSTLDAAVTAASNAAHKAEAQGYDAMLTINTPATAQPPSERLAEDRDAAEPMAGYVALLYSILLPTGRLRMAAWREVLEAEGFQHVRTALATGNAVFTAKRMAVPDLEARLEGAYERTFGRRVDHIVRTAAAFRTLAAANPFPAETDSDPAHVAVRVMREPLCDRDLEILSERATPREKVAIVNGDLWLYSPVPPGTSRVVALLSRERSGVGTIRTWNTIRRLGEMLEEGE